MVELARNAFQDKVVQMELEWAEHLIAEKQVRK